MKALELTIGPSNGWLYAAGTYSTFEHNNFLRITGAGALEIALVIPEQPRIDALRAKRRFVLPGYKSLHAPNYDPAESMESQVALASEMVRTHKPAVALVHPSLYVKDADSKPQEQQMAESMVPVAYYAAMKDADVPLAVENMDKNKPSGKNIGELDELVDKYSMKFVLDVQHAYEQDPDMEYAKDLFIKLADRLTHIHISGEVAEDIPDRNHQLVHKSDNAEAILRFAHGLLLIENVPIIIEGKYVDAGDLKREIEFLKRELG